MGQGSSVELGSRSNAETTFLGEYDDQDPAIQTNSLKQEVMQMVSGDISRSSSFAGDDDASAVPTQFTWMHGGAEVYITGSFKQWLTKIPMILQDKPSGHYSLILDVPPGKHLYKFIVDGQWRFAPEQPTEVDEDGTINNVIVVLAQDDDDDNSDESYDGFGQVIPGIEEYTADPPILPPHLGVVLLNATVENHHMPELDPVVLPMPQHVTLNHLFVSSKKTNKDDQDRVIVLGMTQRYKTKFVTTVYYKYRPQELPGIKTDDQ